QGPPPLFFSQQVQANDSSTDILVLHGDYTCWATIAGQAVQATGVTVGAGGSSDVTVPILQKNGSVHAYLQDQNGQAVAALPNVQYSIWPSTAEVIDGEYGSLTNDEVTTAIAPNVSYRA